jgi:hypothetical protein
VYSIGNNFGYRILSEDDVVLINQEFDPELVGFNAMDEEKAGRLAVAYITNYVTPSAEVIPPTVEQELEELKVKNAALEVESELLKARSSQLQDDNNFILETLATAGLLD